MLLIYLDMIIISVVVIVGGSSGVARPGPTRACALPSAAQQTHVIP